MYESAVNNKKIMYESAVFNGTTAARCGDGMPAGIVL